MRRFYTIASMMLMLTQSGAMAQEVSTEKTIEWSTPANYNSEALDADYSCIGCTV